MKQLLVVFVVCGLLTACGSSQKAQVQQVQKNPQAKADEAKAQAIYHKCVKHVTILKTKAGRMQVLNCAIPPKNQKAALHCEYTGLGFHVPTEPRLIQVTLNCIGRYA